MRDMARLANAICSAADAALLGRMLLRHRKNLFETCDESNRYCRSNRMDYASSHYCIPGIGGTIARLLLDWLMRCLATRGSTAVHS